MTDGTTFLWEFVGSVKVSAGTFTDCWNRRVLETPEVYWTYCPGVGPVRQSLTDFRIELASLSLVVP